MKKSKLKKIPLRERNTERNSCKYTAESELAKVEKDIVLIVNIYLGNSRTPDYRIFLSENDYITEKIEPQQRKWLTGMLKTYTGYYWYTGDRRQEDISKDWFASEETLTNIKSYLSSPESNVYDAVLRHQEKIKENRIAAQRKRYIDPIDKKMEQIREIPKAFYKWVEDDILYRSRYIYYKYSKKKDMLGYCTHCKNDVVIQGAKHNQMGICPSCGCEIKYKAIGKSTKVCDKEKAALIQKNDEGFIVRYFDVRKDYSLSYRDPNLSVYENKRVFYTADLRPESYVWSNFKNVCTRWIYECDEITGGYSDYWGYATWRGNRTVAALYTKNLKQILKDTDLKYSEIWSLAKCRCNYRFDIENFISKIRSGNLCIEKLIKCKLYNLARQVVSKEEKSHIDESAATLNKILGVQNDDARIIIASNADGQTLSIFRKFRDIGKRLTEVQLIEIMKQRYRPENIFTICKYTSPGKALKYLGKQNCPEKDQMYLDYLNMCEKLKMDVKNTFVLFPKNLRDAHDVNVDLINEKENQKTYKQHNTKYAAIKNMNSRLTEMFGYENQKYFIRPPVDAAEIVKEGQKLRHCVGGGGYSCRMANGEIAILFLREKRAPETPYYTIEVNLKDFSIIQYHGYENLDKDKKMIQNFVSEWKRKVLDHLRKRDKKKVG